MLQIRKSMLFLGALVLAVSSPLRAVELKDRPLFQSLKNGTASLEDVRALMNQIFEESRPGKTASVDALKMPPLNPAHAAPNNPTGNIHAKPADNPFMRGLSACTIETVGMYSVGRNDLFCAARSFALDILDKAALNAQTSGDAEKTQIFQTISQKVETASYHQGAFYGCLQTANTFAFNIRGTNDIYLCPLFGREGIFAQAQILIHEASHVAGFHDECQATNIELGAMHRASLWPPFPNGYLGYGICAANPI